MAIRVYLFLEEQEFQFESMENATSEVVRCVENHQISVVQGRNVNHANIEVKCKGIGLNLKFSIGDLWQDKSSMLASLKQSVVEDTEDEEFDYWDDIPPFGVVELYGIELERDVRVTEAEATAFFMLLDQFLSKHFMMYTLLESELHQSVRPYLIDNNYTQKKFIYNGETGYRIK